MAVLIIVLGVFYFTTNETLPKGVQGKEADELAHKMLKTLNYEAFKNTELITWSFRDNHFYKWHKQENIVSVSWGENQVILYTESPEKSEVFVNNIKVKNSALITKATHFFNNDSFWLVAPYKVFDPGTERRIVTHQNKKALLVSYTSGGSTPGDSYLWILDENGLPTSYKMWTKIIPIGGVSATWEAWKKTSAGIQLPTKHTLSLFGMELNMENVAASNPEADELATKILAAIKHENYKKTTHLSWSFGGRRFYEWNKKEHIVMVSWDSIRVILQPNNLDKSKVFFNKIEQEIAEPKIVTRALNSFNNDSFWLVAPHKLFENGIIRNQVEVAKKDALKVTYTTGGTTPGDSYIWLLDSNGMPMSYLMNVKSMKMVEVPATWENWITTESGTLLPTSHAFANGNTLSMGEVKGSK